MSILKKIEECRPRKLFAVLIDPDKYDHHRLAPVISAIIDNQVDLVFIGGSLLTHDHLDASIQQVKARTDIPVVLFPGSLLQISDQADALLLLSLISGRNADFLIGKHVIAAPYLKDTNLELLPTGYMLIESGPLTTAQYITNTFPIPRSKDDIAACTAMAGEMLGLKIIYMDAGSGAKMPVSTSMIKAVRKSVDIPLIVGGGIRTAAQAEAACKAGADIVVVGNAIEQDPSCIEKITQAVHAM